MAEFVVKIADDRGHTHQQVEHGYSVAEVRDRFAAQGYLVHWVKPQGLLTGGLGRGGRKLKQGSFLVFNQQFLTLIKAGLPILNSLDLLIKRQKDANLRQILENVRERVKGGELLSAAFSTHAVVPKIYTTTLMQERRAETLMKC
jgi:type IV pilus assembly protein PilC